MHFADSYGIVPDNNFTFDVHQVDSVFLKRPIKISHLAEILDIEEGFLEKINPVYTEKMIPHVKDEPFSIFLPKYKWGLFINNEDSIYALLKEMERLER